MKREPEAFTDDDLLLSDELLGAWPAPPPPPGLADRVLARRQAEPARLQPEDQPVMQPTPLRHPSERSLLVPVALGFGVAAALLLAFYLGRGSAPPPVATPATPNIELNVAAPPAPVVMPPPVEPARPEHPQDMAPPVEESEAVEAEPKPKPTARKGSKRRGRINADLKNPFADDSPPSPKAAPPSPASGAAKDPFGSSTPKGESKSGDLENPFEPDVGTLRIGTDLGEPPARVSIDGVDRGKTPLARIRLSPGKHTVVFLWADGTSDTEEVTVKSGQSHIVRGHR